MEKIGVVVYRLQLLAGAKLHPVFHCSLPIADPKQLPLEVIDNQSVLTPLSILDSKLDESTHPTTKLVLVQWVG